MLNPINKDISNSEDIVRVLLNPIHINKSNEIIPYAFKPPVDSEDISVNRLSLTTYDICKEQGLRMQNGKNTFYGLGIVTAGEIREIGFDVLYTPIINHPKYPDNLAHADIKIGEIVQKETPLKIVTTLKIKQLIAKINVIVDSKPEADL